MEWNRMKEGRQGQAYDARSHLPLSFHPIPVFCEDMNLSNSTFKTCRNGFTERGKK